MWIKYLWKKYFFFYLILLYDILIQLPMALLVSPNKQLRIEIEQYKH